MRKVLLLVCLILGISSSSIAEVSINIGINLNSYPEFVAIPGYPVYYAPRSDANIFFYDGFYWVCADDNWYSSSWYNGPWDEVDAYYVPLFLLRVPVRYYRRPPSYFRGWRADAAPRWGEHWGRRWEQNRRGWDQWDRRAAPRPAPLPTYQRNYSGDRYPRGEQQRSLRDQNYRYQPREALSRDREQQRQTPQQQRNEQPRPQQQPQRSEQPRPQQQPQRNEQPPQQPSSQQRNRGSETRQHDAQQPGSPQQPASQPRGNSGNERKNDERKPDNGRN